MLNPDFKRQLETTLDEIHSNGLFKQERLIAGPQSASIDVHEPVASSVDQVTNLQAEVLNLCANNYLGLANHPELIGAAKDALDSFGYGMSSVRFICGTQTIHRQLERNLATWLGYDDAILYAACFDANGGLFEPLLSAEDAIVSDSLNHASIIDGIRLCKARRLRFSNGDMGDLRTQLEAAKAGGARHIMIATDGVFSMDGYLAKLPEICDLADQFEAMIMVDDCHATGFMGSEGRGTAELLGCEGRIDILTSTLGKAMGGAMGGFTCGSQRVIDLLRQRSRPYLFSNSLAPSLAGASIKAIEIVSSQEGISLRKKLFENESRFREGVTKAGFKVPEGQHAIIPIMLGDAKLAQRMSAELFESGVYAVGFFFPVVPKGTARIRTQMSAAHSPEQVDAAVAAFIEVGKRLGVI